ncbi:MAG TPA: DUF6166 domain-containing protein, partial [Candidatus Acidoferrales bacterium]|nr:DUF6166 domain-containing protein [Candidatus Acidoferrales bacterium]
MMRQHDVVIQRERDGTVHVNIKAPRLVYHSPTGYEYGYGGSGPSDLALNVLEEFYVARFPTAERSARLYKGMCTEFTMMHHNDFKFAVIARLDRNVDTHRVSAESINRWITDR